jgi:hypothetical protein
MIYWTNNRTASNTFHDRARSQHFACIPGGLDQRKPVYTVDDWPVDYLPALVPHTVPPIVRAVHWLRDGTPPGYFKVLAITAILAFVGWVFTWALP